MPVTLDAVKMTAGTTKQEKSKSGADSISMHLVCGTDEFEVSRNSRHLVETMCPPEDRALGLEIIDGACDTIEEATTAIRKCLDALQTVGFFGSSKIVWLRDASFFYDGKPGKFEDVKKAVATLTEELKRGLMPGVRLVISATSVDKRTSFFKTMEKGGRIEYFNLPEKDYKWDEHAVNVLRGMLDDCGLKARADVIDLMVDRAGNQPRQLASEVEKLALYMKDRKEVTTADIMTIVSPARERGFGELSQAFSQRDLSGTLRIMYQLIQQKENAVGLIISLENRVRELLVYRTALTNRWARLSGRDDWPKIDWMSSPEAEAFFSQLANDPRKANPFWAGKLAGWANKFSLQELKSIQRVLVEEHGRMTEGAAPAETLLEWAVVKSLGNKS
jgi:DNA polymerase-3 subunit delta